MVYDANSKHIVQWLFLGLMRGRRSGNGMRRESKANKLFCIFWIALVLYWIFHIWSSMLSIPQFINVVLCLDTFTVTQAVNAFGFGKFQAKLSLFTGLCWMADSMEMTILSILSPALHCEWHISRYQQALATTVSCTAWFTSD